MLVLHRFGRAIGAPDIEIPETIFYPVSQLKEPGGQFPASKPSGNDRGVEPCLVGRQGAWGRPAFYFPVLPCVGSIAAQFTGNASFCEDGRS
jgi:hypothetical protein